MRLFALRMLAVVLLAAMTGAANAAAATDDAARLLQRAERALDLKEIERLQRSYGYYIDHSDWDNVVDLLTDDATAEYGQSGVYQGKASIRGVDLERRACAHGKPSSGSPKPILFPLHCGCKPLAHPAFWVKLCAVSTRENKA